MATVGDPGDIYRAINVKPIITASGSTTAYGGSKLRPEVKEAMDRASGVMVSLDELNREAGKIIAQVTGAEAGFVSSGASGGLVLQAAAVIAGLAASEEETVRRHLPDPLSRLPVKPLLVLPFSRSWAVNCFDSKDPKLKDTVPVDVTPASSIPVRVTVPLTEPVLTIRRNVCWLVLLAGLAK